MMDEKQASTEDTVTRQGSTLQRDVAVLAILIGLLYGLTQLTNLDVIGNLQQTFGNGYTVTNNCAFPLVVATDSREVARVTMNETQTFQPPANGEIYLAVGEGERTRFTLYLPDAEIELAGKSFPSRSDLYRTDARLIACPEIDR